MSPAALRRGSGGSVAGIRIDPPESVEQPWCTRILVRRPVGGGSGCRRKVGTFLPLQKRAQRLAAAGWYVPPTRENRVWRGVAAASPPAIGCFETVARLRWGGVVSITPARRWRWGEPYPTSATESGSAPAQTTPKSSPLAHRPDELGCPAPGFRWLGGWDPHRPAGIRRATLVHA